MIRIPSLAIVAVLAVGCSSQSRSDNAPSTAPAAQATTPASSAANEQTVTLTGCLTGGEAAVGTTGASARPPVATTKTSDEAQALQGDNASGANRFVLTHATPASNDRRGVGSNGAGGSDGPLVNGVADYTLVGNLAQLAEHLNQQVKVSARINARDAADVPRSDVKGEVPNSNAATEPSSTGTAGIAVGATLLVDSIQMVSPTCTQQ